MQHSAASAWLLVGVLLSAGITFLGTLLAWVGWEQVLGFLFYFLVISFIALLPYLGLMLFRRFFIERRPASNSLQWKTVKTRGKL